MRSSIGVKAAVLVLMALGSAPAAWADDDGCPKYLQQRTTAQVFADHSAALLSGNSALVACDYASDASIVMAGSVSTGTAAITALFDYFYSLMRGPATLTPVSLTIHDEVVFLEWTLDSPGITIGQGIDTIIVRKGRIVSQTIHLGEVVIH